MSPVSILSFAIVLVVLATVGALKIWAPELDAPFILTFSAEQISQMLISTGGMIIAALTAVPAEMVAIANGMVFGPVLGFALTWTGGMIGATIAFFAARLIGRTPILKLVGPEKVETLDKWVQRYGVFIFLIARLIPFIPFFMLNYGAGLLNLRFSSYFAVTAIGIIPMTALCVSLGDRVVHSDWTAIMTISALIILTVGIAYCIRRKRMSF